jgi:hypothetical protein
VETHLLPDTAHALELRRMSLLLVVVEGPTAEAAAGRVTPFCVPSAAVKPILRGMLLLDVGRLARELIKCLLRQGKGRKSICGSCQRASRSLSSG